MKDSCTRQWHTIYFQSEIKRRQVRSSQGTCDSKGLGDLPTSWKTLKSAEAEMSVFRIWRAISIACDFCRSKVCGHRCIACQGYTKFGIKLASNASVYTNAKNHPFRLHGTNGFSACWGAAPSPAEHCVMFWKRWINPAAARFWESLFFESSVRQRGLALYLFTLTDIGWRASNQVLFADTSW